MDHALEKLSIKRKKNPFQGSKIVALVQPEKTNSLPLSPTQNNGFIFVILDNELLSYRA